MAANYEMFSFIEKFNQMTLCGFMADLNFSCKYGRVSVQLSADLGYLNPGVCFNTYPTTASFSSQPEKPSKVRRRHRRAHSRNKRNLLDVVNVLDESDLINKASETMEDASSAGLQVEAVSNDFNHETPPDELAALPNSVDDAKIDYFLSSHTTQPIDDFTVLNSTSVPVKMCCPCCCTPTSRARNCPGSGVAQTTYIRCCFHKHSASSLI